MPSTGSFPTNPSAGTTVSLKEHLEKLIIENNTRFERIIAELIIRFDQRAEASEKAVQAAAIAADRATSAAFSAAKEAVSAAFQASEKANNSALLNAQAAVNKAEASTDRRLEGMNEVRDQLGTQAATMVLKVQHDAEIAALTERQNEMKARLDLQAGKTSGFTTGWGILVAIIGVLFAVASFAMRFVK